MYSDGITEAEDRRAAVRRSRPRTDAGALSRARSPEATAASVGQAIFDAVERHRRDSRLADDLTVLVLSRLETVARASRLASNLSCRAAEPSAAMGPTGQEAVLKPAVASSVSPRWSRPSPRPAIPCRRPEEDLSIQAFLQAVETAISTMDRAPDGDLSRRTPIAIRPPSSSSTRWCRRASRAPSSENAIARRSQGTLPGEGYRLVVDVFTETGPRGRITTWRLDIRRPRDDDRAPAVAHRRRRNGCRRSKGCIACRCNRTSSSPRAIW